MSPGRASWLAMTDGLAPRRAAAHAFTAVIKQKRMLETALDHAPGFAEMSVRDRAFARAIAAVTFRRLGQTRTVLDKFLSRPLSETSDGAQAILVTGAAQMLWLDSPAHAVVSSAVSLAAERQDSHRLKGLINAVLRKVDREGREVLKGTVPRDNLPDWLRESWRAAYGPGGLSGIVNAMMATPPLDLTLKNPAERDKWAEALDARVLANGSLRLNSVGDVRALAGFREGAWWAQDAAASMPAMLLGAQPGESVIDMCAAPGGKTLQLAARGARVTAVDTSEARLKRLHENLSRTGLSAEIEIADGRRFKPAERPDAVLLDAPCTATGTLRRHPEATVIKRPSDIGKLAKLQRELAGSAVRMLKPGGRLVVCTCSLQPEEGEEFAADLLKAHRELKTVPIRSEECPEMDRGLSQQGWLRLTPAMWSGLGGIDGFFIARFQKQG